MTECAAVSSDKLVELLDALPDYGQYERSERARDLESPYRIALGRLTKEWGDHLLDIAEHPVTPLTRAQARTIDLLLERISDIFQVLNSLGPARLDPRDADVSETLRRHDGCILALVEETLSLLDSLHQRDMAGVWLQEQAGPFYRRLRRLLKELRARNRLLDRRLQDPGARRARRRDLSGGGR